METLYSLLYDLWITYINPTLPLPDYVLCWFNIVCFIMLLILVFAPVFIVILIVNLFRRVFKGRGFND